MIYVDWKSCIIATCMAAKSYENLISVGMIRPVVLKTMMDWQRSHGREYGQMIICDDSKEKNWRKDIFPAYKHGRKDRRKDDPETWKSIFEVSDILKDEMHKHGIAVTLTVPGTEADDIIAILSKFNKEKALIISNDQDFHQLHNMPHVYQYAPIKDILYRSETPLLDLATKIIKGDRSDSIPNVLSPDDVFVEDDKKQYTVSKKRLEEYQTFYESKEFPEEISINVKKEKVAVPIKRNYKRNRDLIDFRRIPKHIAKYILVTYKKRLKTFGDSTKSHMYLVQNDVG